MHLASLWEMQAATAKLEAPQSHRVSGPRGGAVADATYASEVQADLSMDRSPVKARSVSGEFCLLICCAIYVWQKKLVSGDARGVLAITGFARAWDRGLQVLRCYQLLPCHPRSAGILANQHELENQMRSGLCQDVC